MKWILQLYWCTGEELDHFYFRLPTTFLILHYLTQTKVPKSPNVFDKYLFISSFTDLIFIFSFVLFYHLPCFIHINIIYYIENCKKKWYAEHYDNLHSLIEENIYVTKTMLICDATIPASIIVALLSKYMYHSS